MKNNEAILREALERIADRRNTHFAGDAQALAQNTLATLASIEQAPDAEQSAGAWQVPDIGTLVNRFLAWPLPSSVRSDDCATIQGYRHRIGTNLLTADEAKAMFIHCLAASLPTAIAA